MEVDSSTGSLSYLIDSCASESRYAFHVLTDGVTVEASTSLFRVNEDGTMDISGPLVGQEYSEVRLSADADLSTRPLFLFVLQNRHGQRAMWIDEEGFTGFRDGVVSRVYEDGPPRLPLGSGPYNYDGYTILIRSTGQLAIWLSGSPGFRHVAPTRVGSW